MRSKTQPSYHVRPIVPGDREGLTAFYAGLSADSREARFHGAAPGIGETTARFFCGPDHEHREGIVAEIESAAGLREIVGHVCLEPITSDEVEMAIAVADAWQGQGLGRAMLAEAIRWAGRHGVARLRASMRIGNAAVMGLIRGTGRPIRLQTSDTGVVDALIDIGDAVPTAA
ncbi:MAG: GNAT family N-acetyltransferase [Candidatus Limnocylindrales bacterium]